LAKVLKFSKSGQRHMGKCSLAMHGLQP